MGNKVKLNVLGLSYSQTQAGAYALVLSEENGERRIPIIIGGFEAQSIAIELEGLEPPRPLTHDLVLNLAKAYNINMQEVNIYKLEEGIFYAELICDGKLGPIKIDARTSDAIALALRFKCPIYTTEEIIAKAGIVLDIEIEPVKDADKPKKPTTKAPKKTPQASSPVKELQKMSLTELQENLKKAIQDENYETASKLRDEINLRNVD